MQPAQRTVAKCSGVPPASHSANLGSRKTDVSLTDCPDSSVQAMIRQDVGDDWIPVAVAGRDSEFPRISMRLTRAAASPFTPYSNSVNRLCFYLLIKLASMGSPLPFRLEGAGESNRNK